MDWGNKRKDTKKAMVNVGFNINKGITCKAFITDGNSGERPFVNQILEPGETSIIDPGYQCQKSFDLLQEEVKSFICRIKENTTKTIVKQNSIPEG